MIFKLIVRSDDVRMLLEQMRRSTALIAQRLENAGSPVSDGASNSSSPSVSAESSGSVVAARYTMSAPVPQLHCTPMMASQLLHTPSIPSSSRDDNVQRDLARLFRPYNTLSCSGRGPAQRRKKEVPWSHFFFCLPEPETVSVPTKEEALYYEECGIGKKLVTFARNTGDHSFLSEHLYSAFPLLTEAGGFSLAKSDRRKQLSLLPIPASGYSLEYLRCRVEIKRAPLYIIPLQRALTLQPPHIETTAVMERCLSCQVNVPLCGLAQHIKTCAQTQERAEEAQLLSDERTDNEDEDADLAAAIFESLQADVVVQIEEPPIVLDIEQGEQEKDLASILKDLQSQVDEGPAPPHNCIHVTRDSVLDSAFRALRRQRFNPRHRIDIVFIDGAGQSEGAVDDGGPTREFFRLLVVAIKDSIFFSGSEDGKNLTLVSRALASGEYKLVGKMIALALIHGGTKPSFFSERLYTEISGQDTSDVTLEEVDDWDVKGKLQRIMDATSLEEAQDAVAEACGFLSLLGCASFLSTFEQRLTLVKEAARAFVVGRTQGARTQLVEGLETLGVAEAVRSNPGTLKALFVGGQKQVQLEELLELFNVSFSAPGSNRRQLENTAFIFWKDWLLEVDEGSRPVTLGQILVFASGTDTIPPLGFPTRPKLVFLHWEGVPRIFPEANTCDVTLRLPLHSSYSAFVEHMESGIIQSPTFGFA
ncbi:uncharacterized protein LOC105357912 [Oryzias latipes]